MGDNRTQPDTMSKSRIFSTSSGCALAPEPKEVKQASLREETGQPTLRSPKQKAPAGSNVVRAAQTVPGTEPKAPMAPACQGQDETSRQCARDLPPAANAKIPKHDACAEWSLHVSESNDF